MITHLAPAAPRLERPAWVWLAIGLELFTAAPAIPVGLLFILDPSGASVGVPRGWIEPTVFGSYLVPGLYLLFVNGLGMLVLAALSAARHWLAPWLTGTLGVGLIVWIVVEIAVMPETMFLTWIFLATGLALGLVALFWLRRTAQLRVW
ncbi:MAG TPA: hypothetical protein VFS32_10260 [Candidatus Limnocylindrales bacterium]|nr:hypothetical protein [Candidatus Limnocylindrales bacterium]